MNNETAPYFLPLPYMHTKLKKLYFQSWHRGMRETDLLLGKFADTKLSELDDVQLDMYETILAEHDNDIFDWISGRKEIPKRLDNPVMDMLMEFYKSR